MDEKNNKKISGKISHKITGEFMESINPRVKEYFKLLEPNFPEWLNEYINTKELLKQKYISVTCGTIYSDLFESDFFFSSLDHSVAVALIIWHFTNDKKQTLAGLFHDISTPVFKHCIDFLNGDYMSQESTEDLTKKFISDSEEIMSLLKRDGINISEVDDYHMYTIADNDTPQLASDRLEYSLSNALFTYKISEFEEIKEIYNDLVVLKNENGYDEISFKTKSIARKFVKITSKLSVIYREDRTRYSMQLIADIVKKLNIESLIKIEDLYNYKEDDVIKIIENSKYGYMFNIWKNSKKVKVSSTKPEDVYFVHHGSKIRYIDPLVKGTRISEICKIAKKEIEKNLSYDMNNYVYIEGINFKKIVG